jgi:O-antigen ligase
MTPVSGNKIKEFLQNGNLTFFSSVMTVIILPLHVDYLPPFMMLWVVSWILENYKRFNTIWRINEPPVLLFLGFTVYFLWYISGLFYTSDIHNGTLLVFRRLPFILFPLVLTYPGEAIKKRIKLLLKIFCISTLVYILFTFCFAAFRSLYFTDGAITFNPHPPDHDYDNYFFGVDFAYSQHPTYLAMYVLLSMFFAFESFFQSKVKRYLRIVWLISGFILLTSLYFLSSRTGIISALVLVPVYLIIKLKTMQRWRLSALIIILAVPLLIVLFLNNKRMKFYLPEKTRTSVVDKFLLDNRVPIWKSAMIVIRHNPIIGVGAGDASLEIQKEYIAAGYTEMYYNNLNAHNQYLEVLVASGLIGFVIFITLISYIVYQGLSRRNLLFGIFILIILIFFLFESILNRIAGVTFFSLFSFLLLYLEEGKLSLYVRNNQ